MSHYTTEVECSPGAIEVDVCMLVTICDKRYVQFVKQGVKTGGHVYVEVNCIEVVTNSIH